MIPQAGRYRPACGIIQLKQLTSQLKQASWNTIYFLQFEKTKRVIGRPIFFQFKFFSSLNFFTSVLQQIMVLVGVKSWPESV